MGSSYSYHIDKNRKHIHFPCNNSICKHLPDIDSSYNRPIDTQRIEEYKLAQIQYYNINKHLLPIGIIVLCKYNKKYYIIDGQHRLQAFKKLFDDGYKDDKSFIVFEIIDVNTIDQIQYYFSMYNRGIPTPDYMFIKDDKRVIICIRDLISKRWKDRLSRTINHMPYTIHLDEFCSFLSRNKIVSPDWDDDKCREKINEWNIKCKSLVGYIPNETNRKRCKDLDFYLGLYRTNETEMIQLLTTII